MTDTKGNAEFGPRSPRFPSSKFSPPKTRSRPVRRARLFDDLTRGERARLTLVVGSPGAGKTALLADWVASVVERPFAWLSCDVADADPVRFVAAIIESLRRAFATPEIGEDARQLLGHDGEVSADAVAALADDLEGIGRQVVLVIDDFHLTGADGTNALALLVEYRPHSLQLVVASRVDPQLRLHRMRANDELVEVRDRDLSFSVEEARAFLSGFDVRLSEPHLAMVHRRSEGWAAGLQMVAISVQGSPDPAGAPGRVELHRHSVAGYFLDEVLYRQPPEVIEFMLATSVLDELSVPACTALCGPGSDALLRLTYRAHMFVTVVDSGSGTYRYHQLIKEVLQAELHSRHPARERLLHTAAADYLAGLGQVGLAARHLLDAGDPTAAFRLLSDRVIRDFLANPTVGSALDLAEVQPEVFAGAAEVLVPLATELLVRGAFERGSRAFALAQQAGVDSDRQPDLAVKLALVSSLYCGLIGQLDESLAHQDRARNLAIQVDGLGEWQVGQDMLTMYCYTYSGDYSKARQVAGAVASSQLSPPAVTEVLCPGVISQVALAEGALSEASTLANGAIASAGRLGLEPNYFAFCALRTASLLALERRDLTAATDLNERVLGMLGGGRPIFDYLAQLDRARIWVAGGNVDEALASLPAARTALKGERSVLLGLADELEARFRLALGDHAGARNIAGRLPGDRRMVVAAIIALGTEDPEGVAQFLTSAPAEGPTIRSDLELRLLRASVAIMRSSPQASHLVREALGIVDRYGFIQTVMDTAPPFVDHLISGSILIASTDNLRALIAAGLQARKLTPSRPTGRLPDPLTEAEVRVLEKLPQRLTYLDMASDLHLSLNTVKTHLRHTYMKLGVTSRSSAVERATSLGLL